ncbi:protein hob1 [Physcia stellaris]|nr:protein hob1 [Physcia stellaris]
MAAVPQKVLNWMYNVLKGEYHDPDRTYSDVAQTLAQYPSLSVRTSVYTYENGRPSLLLNLSGTLPTSFRGTTYMFPISLWIPHEYPRDVPMGFATPTKNMVVRAGQYVSGEEIQSASICVDNSRDFLSGAASDCKTRTTSITFSAPNQRRAPTCPPVTTGDGQVWFRYFYRLRATTTPPKEYEGTSQSSIYQGGDGPPPVPPRPQQDKDAAGAGRDRLSSIYGKPPPPIPSSAPQRTSSLRHGFGPEPSEFRNPSLMQQSPRFDIGDGHPGPVPHGEPRISPPQYVNQRLAPLPNGDPPLGSNQHQFPRQPPQQPFNNHYYQQPSHNSQFQSSNERYPPQSQTQPPPPTSQPKKPPPTDLLTSPFDTPSHQQPPIHSPRPTNPAKPQKDALLSHLSSTLTTLATEMHTSNSTALPALLAQHRALSSTLTSINSEISSLEALSSLLTSNEQILHSSTASADAVLADAKTRAVPDIDAVLVAPTRVEGQLYEVVCEERAVRDSRAFLGRCLDRGRVGGEVWARQTRALAREEFGFLVLGRKIARGLGLVVEGVGEGWGMGGAGAAGERGGIDDCCCGMGEGDIGRARG